MNACLKGARMSSIATCAKAAIRASGKRQPPAFDNFKAKAGFGTVSKTTPGTRCPGRRHRENGCSRFRRKSFQTKRCRKTDASPALLLAPRVRASSVPSKDMEWNIPRGHRLQKRRRPSSRPMATSFRRTGSKPVRKLPTVPISLNAVPAKAGIQASRRLSSFQAKSEAQRQTETFNTGKG